jgi:DNA-binding IclR family transcriptional regulator
VSSKAEPFSSPTNVLAEDPYGKSVGAIHRSLEILELFAVEQIPLSVGEVSSKLGFPQSSTSVTLHCLKDLGHLIYDRRSRKFFPTVRVTFLGTWLQHRILNHRSLLEFMEELARNSGHVVLLAMQNGLYAQYMHIVSARSSRVGQKPGLLRPICRSAVGKVLLSSKDDQEIRRVVRNVSALQPPAAPVHIDELMAEIRECRRTGFAFSCDGVTTGSSVIATTMPLDILGAPIAIGIAVHTSEFASLRPRMISLLRDTLAEYFGEGRTASIPAAPAAKRVDYALKR